MKKATFSGILTTKLQVTLDSSSAQLVIYLSQCCTTEMRQSSDFYYNRNQNSLAAESLVHDVTAVLQRSLQQCPHPACATEHCSWTHAERSQTQKKKLGGEEL